MDNTRKWKFIFVQSLTLGRLPLVFVFLVVCVLAPKPLSSFWFSVAFVAMILSAVTDLFDGYFARKFQVVTRMGAYADPLTDKMFYLISFPTLVYLAGTAGQVFHSQLLLILTILFLFRDQWVSFLRSIGAIYNVDGRANWSGKARTVISFPVICMIFYYLAAPSHWWLQTQNGCGKTVYPIVIYSLEFISMAINLISIWVYTAYYWPWLKKEMRTSEGGE